MTVVVRKGTRMPSDLHGINRIDFVDNVQEVLHQLQDELEAAGILPRERAAS